MLERWRPGKSSNPGAAKADGQAWWKLPRRNWRVLGVWSLANGRLECPNKRRLCRQRAGCNAGTLTARKEQQPWSSKGWRPGLVEAAAEGFRHLKPGKRQARHALTREGCAGKGQAAMLERWRPGKSSNPGAAKADGQAWWKLPRRF